MFVLSVIRSRTIALLALLCLVLALVAVGELDASSSPASAKSLARSLQTAVDGGAAATSSPPPPFSLPPLQSFADVKERPLFSTSRRPAPASSGEPDAWSSFVLAGIILSEDLREAMVLHSQPSTLVHVKEGDAIDGWTLASLFSDRAVFRNGDAEHELKLNIVPSAKAPVAPPGARNTSIGQGPILPPPRG
jgi:type II secretory pathway component PulC